MSCFALSNGFEWISDPIMEHFISIFSVRFAFCVVLSINCVKRLRFLVGMDRVSPCKKSTPLVRLLALRSHWLLYSFSTALLFTVTGFVIPPPHPPACVIHRVGWESNSYMFCSSYTHHWAIFEWVKANRWDTRLKIFFNFMSQPFYAIRCFPGWEIRVPTPFICPLSASSFNRKEG